MVVEATPLLHTLWNHIFVDIVLDNDIEKITDIEAVLSHLQQLSPALPIRVRKQDDSVERFAGVQMTS